jgi:hypothetical protein
MRWRAPAWRLFQGKAEGFGHGALTRPIVPFATKFVFAVTLP